MSWAYAVTQIRGGLLGPIEGLLIQKLGPRRAVFIGLTIFGLGFLLFSQIRELWQLYTIFFILSLGAGLGAIVPMQSVINNWFVRYKTRAMSLQLEGIAIGGIVVPLLLAWSIGGSDPATSERYGWSNTAIFIGVLITALAFPLSQLIQNRPEDVGLLPDGDSNVLVTASHLAPSAISPGREPEGYTLQEALRTKSFWLISFGHAASVMVTATISVHLGLMLDDRGFSLLAISAVVAVYTAVNAIFILIGGYLGDRSPIRLVAFWFSILQALALVVLVMANNTEMLFLFAVLFGVGRGFMPVTTAMRGIYFGRKAFAVITGVAKVPSNISVFIAPLFAGFIRDATGTYDVSFLTIAAISAIGSLLFLFLGEPTRLSGQTARSSQIAD